MTSYTEEYYEITFEHNGFCTSDIMTANDAMRYAAVTGSRIIKADSMDPIGRVWNVNYKGEEEHLIVIKKKDGRLFLENGNKLSRWQEKNIDPLDEIII